MQDFLLSIEKDLVKLPPTIQVAIASRCALRVMPLIHNDLAVELEVKLIYAILFSVNFLNNKGSSYISGTYGYAPSTNTPEAAINAINSVSNAANSSIAARSNDMETTTSYSISAADEALKANILSKDKFVDEIKVDLNYIINNYSNSEEFIDQKFYSRPLWTSLNPKQSEKISDNLSKWLEYFDKDKRQSTYDHYVRFLDAEQYGKIEWEILKEKVDDWIRKFEEANSNLQDLSKYLESTDEEEDNQEENKIDVATMHGNGLADEDLLGRERLIDVLSNMIVSDEQDTPFVIGLFGDWGAGKSSLMKLIEADINEKLRDDNNHFHFAQFNAWEYENTENMTAGLGQEVIRALTKDLNFCQLSGLRLKFGLKKHGKVFPFFLF